MAGRALRTGCNCCIITAWGREIFQSTALWNLVSTAPARIFGMYPKKGVLAAGSDADLVLMGSEEANHTISAATHHMRVDYSMFEGFKVREMRAMSIRAAN